MTDKQIIIDGVPVQDCCYFDYENDGYEDSCYIHQNECSAQNCYYKQLKRKEQECEELKNFHINLVGVKECEIKELLKLKQTLTEIKELCEQHINAEKIVMADEIILKINEVLNDR